MSDEQSELVHGVSEGGMAAKHPPSDEYAIVVGPKTGAEFNRIRSWLIPVACWRVDDLRFAFDSSFVQPEIKTELAHLAQLVKEHPESPLSIFGHADPTGEDSYNKVLSGRRAKVIYALLISNTAPEDAAQLWEQVGAEEHWGVTENQTMQAVTGLSEGTPRKSLVQAYMQQLCDPELKLEKNKDFLA
ncbi:MAG: OmpA family protein, partial [Deltaproteobacteria bacterium]|nr:OmpA family protein [Deltaproteobacteria bacterium]